MQRSAPEMALSAVQRRGGGWEYKQEEGVEEARGEGRHLEASITLHGRLQEVACQRRNEGSDSEEGGAPPNARPVGQLAQGHDRDGRRQHPCGGKQENGKDTRDSCARAPHPEND